jgi:hypothetical protein
MSASVAWVALKRAELTIPPGEVGFTGSRCIPGTCEQAAVTWRAVPTMVLAANCTTTHCWPIAAFICAHPLTRPATATAQAASRTRVADTAQA